MEAVPTAARILSPDSLRDWGEMGRKIAMADADGPNTPKCEGPEFLLLEKATDQVQDPPQCPRITRCSIVPCLDDKNDNAQSPVSRAHYGRSHYPTSLTNTESLTKITRPILWH